MTGIKVKIIFCLVWAFSIVGFLCFKDISPASGQTKGAKSDKILKPSGSLVDRFDAAMQLRFLTAPNFGIRRIQPVFPPSPHLEDFSPNTEEERTGVSDFENEGWKVSLYLYGRRATPKIVKGKETEKFTVKYRLNEPLLITGESKKKNLPKSERLLKEVKNAFSAFQSVDSPDKNEYEFSIGKWFYVAKPVRAANQSCLKCHTDYVVTERFSSTKFKVRKRQIGDVNGVIVYGFAKED